MKTLKQGDLVLQKVSDETELKGAEPAFNYEFKKKIRSSSYSSFLNFSIRHCNRNMVKYMCSVSMGQRFNSNFKIKSTKGNNLELKKSYLKRSLGALQHDFI